MKSEFEVFRIRGKGGVDPTSVRLPDSVKTRLEGIAAVEGDSVAGLILEGAVRVIQDRASDPAFQQQVAEHIANISLLGTEMPAPENNGAAG